MSFTVRPEEPADGTAVYQVNAAAFERPDEADLVAALTRQEAVTISLVAEMEGRLVGHILFSPVIISGEDGGWTAVALGPMAVLPTDQGQGIGSALIRAGLAACLDAGHEVVFVLGHPTYYPRFGFRPAPLLGLQPQWAVPDDVFMVVELREGALNGRRGQVRYHPAFDGV